MDSTSVKSTATSACFGRASFSRFSLATILALLACGHSLLAQTYTPLHTYSINKGNYSGVLTEGVISQGRDGYLYSTLNNAGTVSTGDSFKISTAGDYSVLNSFCLVAGCTDGSYPDGGLTLGTDGNYYGTTSGGGSKNVGTIFKVTKSGALTTLFSFTGGTEGGNPFFPPVEAQNGNYYGAAPAVYAGDYGALYKISSSGTVTTFVDFNYTNGNSPNNPTQGTDGSFYGSTRGGGSAGLGVVYKATTSGTVTVLHNFLGGTADGNFPVGSLVQGNDGNFYGVTFKGGASNAGIVFKITSSGKFTLLHSFVGGANDGAFPWTGLTLGTDGNFYGTTNQGGKGAGMIFKITPAGQESILYTFCSSTCLDGEYPATPLVQHTNGKFYGNTDGNSLGGSVFYSLDMGLGPFARLVTWKAAIAKKIGILGQGFTGTSSVSFNGTAASFSVVSDTYLTATVPAAATTGFVTVTTPTATLTSDRKFMVLPSITSFSPSSGPVGTSVTITGNNFTGATKVTFGGVKATSFTVVSDTKITATVPPGAVTGQIKVTTAGGTATSSSSFTVTP